MFLGRKNQYCENDYTTKHNLQIQRDPCQITNENSEREIKESIPFTIATKRIK